MAIVIAVVLAPTAAQAKTTVVTAVIVGPDGGPPVTVGPAPAPSDWPNPNASVPVVRWLDELGSLVPVDDREPAAWGPDRPGPRYVVTLHYTDGEWFTFDAYPWASTGSFIYVDTPRAGTRPGWHRTWLPISRVLQDSGVPNVSRPADPPPSNATPERAAASREPPSTLTLTLVLVLALGATAAALLASRARHHRARLGIRSG